MTSYQDKPWLAQLTDAQRAPVQPPPSTLHAFRASVRRAPGRTALAYFDGRLSYAETDALSDGIAGRLAGRGFRRGDRAAVMLQNTPHFVLAVLGVWKAGGVVVPVNPMYKSAEMRHILDDAEVTAVICADRTWDGFLRVTAAEAPSVRIALTAHERDLQTRDDRRVLHGERVGPLHGAEDLLTVARTPGRIRVAPADPGLTAGDLALISYTSGTSGTPKGATNTHGNITYNAERQRTGLGLPDGATYFALAPSSTSPAWSANWRPVSPTRAPWCWPTASRRASSWTPSWSTAPPTRSAPRPPIWR